MWSRARQSDFTCTFHFHALEKEMATPSSVLAWRIPGMGEPGGLPSIGSHRVGHDWSDLAAAAAGLSRHGTVLVMSVMAERPYLHWGFSNTWSSWPCKTALASTNGPNPVLLLVKSVSPLWLPISSSFTYASQRFCCLQPSPCSRLEGEIWNRFYWHPPQTQPADWSTQLAAPEGM